MDLARKVADPQWWRKDIDSLTSSLIAAGAASALLVVYWSRCPKYIADVPSKMQVLHLVNGDVDLEKVLLKVEAVDTPVPRPGQVLVKMAAAPINPTDAGEWRHKSRSSHPQQLGIEGSGIVVATGGGLLGRFLLGRKVGVIGARTYGEYAVTSALGGALPLPARLPVEDGCSFFINPFTVIGMVDTARSLGAKAFINTGAASQLGIMLAGYCAAKGVTLVSLVRGPQQAQRLQKAGSKYVVDTSKHSWEEELSTIVRAEKIRLAFDCLSGKATGIMLRALPPGSTVFVYGGLADEQMGNIAIADLIYKRKKLKGWLLTKWLWDSGVWRGLWRLYATHREVSQLLDTTFATAFKDVSLDTAFSIYKDWRKGSKLRILLNAAEAARAFEQDSVPFR
mmetsp:Transcript_26779/g.49210  ORF Transcript_26779/g.49210 Transcript_26779/m.49210 type:complete len:395 (+) Transcript_26779:74-1258(+)